MSDQDFNEDEFIEMLTAIGLSPDVIMGTSAPTPETHGEFFKIDIDVSSGDPATLTTAELLANAEVQRDFLLGALLRLTPIIAEGMPPNAFLAASLADDAIHVACDPAVVASLDGDQRKAMICGMTHRQYAAAKELERLVESGELDYADAMMQLHAVVTSDL